MELDLKELEKIEKVKNSYTYPERVYEKIIYKNLNKLPINMKECALANIVKFIKHSHLVATCDVDEALFFNKNGIPFTRKIDEKFINDFKTIYEEVENKYQKITNYPNDFSFITKSPIFKININNYLKKYINIDKNTLYIMTLFYDNIDTLNKNLKILNSLTKEEQSIVIEYVKPLSFNLIKKYAGVNSVYRELYCYFNEHYIKSFKLITDLMINKDKNKQNILLNYKKYLESDYPEYYPGEPSEYIQYGEWEEVADNGADTEAAWYPTHEVYVPKTKTIDHPASIPTYILENLEVTLKTLEKKDFPNLDLNLLMFNYNFLKNNVYNVINNILQNHQNKESNKIINQWQQCIDTFLKEINKTFNHNLTFNINLNDLTITNLLDIENSYLSLNFSLNNIYKMLLNLVNEYLKCNFQISNDELMYNVEFYINEYRIFLMKKLEVKLSKIFNDFKSNISILLSDEYSQNQLEKINNSLKLTLK